MTNISLVVGNILFHARHDRMEFVNSLNVDRQRWLEEWQYVEDD